MRPPMMSRYVKMALFVWQSGLNWCHCTLTKKTPLYGKVAYCFRILTAKWPITLSLCLYYRQHYRPLCRILTNKTPVLVQ
jgi:hypothetical protein